MKRNIALLMVLTLLCAALVPAVALGEARYGIIQGGSLHMRTEPSFDAPIEKTYDSGTWVQILDDSNGTFYHVETSEGHQGYMMAKYIIEDTLEPGSWGTVENGERYVNLRTGPSTDYPVIARFNTGARFELLEYGEIFSKVRFYGSQVGYMSSGLFRLDDETVWEENYTHADNGGNVNLRTGPSFRADVIDSYPVGTKVIILIQGISWHKVYVKGHFGYMDADFLDYENGDYESGWEASQGTRPFHSSKDGDPTVLSYDDFTPDAPSDSTDLAEEGQADG